MLNELSITNFGIIKSIRLSFDKGLTVITGETGAGKSMIIDAIGLLTGGRGSADFVRHGESKAEIEGLFFVEAGHPCLEKMNNVGLDTADGMIVLHREISKNGKSVCRINGKLMTLAVLRDIGGTLIDIHSQHEHQDLLQADRQLPLLDSFGGESLLHAKEAYRKQYESYREMERKLRQFARDEKEAAQRIDLLRFQLDEIDHARLKPGEDEQLANEKAKLANYEKMFEAFREGYEALYGEQKGLYWIGRAMNDLQSVEDLDDDYKKMSETVSDSYYLLEETAFSLRDTLEHMEYDPERLNAIEERLHDIQGLKRKYGDSVAEILEYREKIAAELDTVLDRDKHVEELQKSLDEAAADLLKKAKTLSREREKTADILISEITRELEELHMAKTAFHIQFAQTETAESGSAGIPFYKDGIDRVEFLISTNPGEPPKPLSKVASGGELSRMMLALKSVFSRGEGITSIIFDEVDTGVSGRAAQSMAEKIYRLSVRSQVFCITHLPQVAAMADTHLYITKQEHNDRTTTSVHTLSLEQKTDEVGRMISGAEMTDLTKKHAKELLDLASQIKATS